MSAENEKVYQESEIEWVEGPAANVLADSAAFMYNSFADVDTAMMDKRDQRRIQDIKRMALTVAHHYLKEIYDGLPE